MRAPCCSRSVDEYEKPVPTSAVEGSDWVVHSRRRSPSHEPCPRAATNSSRVVGRKTTPAMAPDSSVAAIETA